jgi:hypothetical protein
MRSKITTFALALLLWGCASYDGRGLAPGTPAAQVEALMGPAAEQRTVAGGDTVRYYSRLPYGGETYAARFGPDGRLKSIEQRLTVQNVAKLVPGTSRAADVRDLLGPPWRDDQFPRLGREILTYPMHAPDPTPKHLYVQLSQDGIVREVYLMDDPDWRARDTRD